MVRPALGTLFAGNEMVSLGDTRRHRGASLGHVDRPAGIRAMLLHNAARGSIDSETFNVLGATAAGNPPSVCR